MQKYNRIHHALDIVRPLVKDKEILDIGCIGHHYESRLKIGTFYQETFRNVAAYSKGIDILSDAVAAAAQAGYNVAVGNAETFVDDRQYDCIFAGELIEHLNNPGLFLECCAKNLKPDGVLVLTTPNTFAFSRLLRVLTRFTNEPPLNPEHTCYFTPQTLKQLYARYGFIERAIYYSNYDYGSIDHSITKKFMLSINVFISSILPQFSQSFVVVLAKSG